jgi:serine/threonine-protein kinase
VSEAIYRLRAVARYALALGQYKLRQHIGSGGMGEVYVAEHAALRRPTAVKLIRPDRVTKAYVTRFEREAQLMARLTHPNTVTVYDYGRTSGGVFYIAMEYLQGIDLERLVERWGPQHPGRVVRIMAQTCGSLGEAHASGLVHRDLKPANLMLLPKHGQRELIKVLDFGLAKTMLEDGLELSAAGSLVGTPQYIAPECLRGEKLDGRTDLYMLGAIAYFLLTGQTPFERKTLAETCAAHLNDPVIPPSQVRGEPIPAALEALVLSCLAKQRDERPASAEALHQALVAADVPEFTAEDEAKFWEEAKDILAQPESQKNREPLTVSQLWGRGA